MLSALALLPQGREEWDLGAPAPVADGRAAVLDRLDEVSCTECHAAIVDEWAGTAHALAWVDEIYQEELVGRRRPETCHGCHIPEPLHLGELGVRPDARAEGLHFGVSCEACHLAADGAMLGPRGIATDAHATERSESMVGAGTNALCSTCHRTNIGPVIGIAKDFEGSDLAERGGTCVGCHMAPVERPDGTTTRSHALQTPRDPAFLRRAFEVSVSVEGGATVVTIANRAGHRVPGLLGREIELTAEIIDPSGAVLASGVLELSTRTFLPVGESARLVLAAVGAQVRVTGLHHDPRLEDPVPFLREELAP